MPAVAFVKLIWLVPALNVMPVIVGELKVPAPAPVRDTVDALRFTVLVMVVLRASEEAVTV